MIIILLASSSSVFSKSLGNYKSYSQITDKEVLIETTNGAQVLISAYNDFAIGISVSSDKELNLVTPNKIKNHSDLNGSIYVEELDELMQITTAINDGVVIKIEKSPLRLTYIDKSSSEILFEEIAGVKFSKNSNSIRFSVDENEELNVISYNNYTTTYNSIEAGLFYDFNAIEGMVNDNHETCLVSSKGYAVVLDSKYQHEIDHKKSDKLKISTQSESDNFNYLLIYGPNQPQLIEKYAFHNNNIEKQISLK